MIRNTFTRLPMYRTLKDVASLIKKVQKRLENEESNLEENITDTDTGLWLMYEARRFLYDCDSQEEMKIESQVFRLNNPLPEEKLTEFQKERLDNIPIEVEVEDDCIRIIIKEKLKKSDYVSGYLLHNLGNEVEAKLNYLENIGESLVFYINPQFSFRIHRYVVAGKNAKAVFDSSNLEAGNLINTLMNCLHLRDGYYNMLEYSVINHIAKSQDEEKVVIEIRSLYEI